MEYSDREVALEGKSERRIMLVGSYPLEHVNGEYFAPRNYLNHWHRLADCCDGIDFHAHVWEVETPQYDSYVDTSRIQVFPLNFLSKSHKQRGWRDFVYDQKLLLNHMENAVGWIESFPAAGGLFSPIYYLRNSKRRIVYLKVDWREQILHRINVSGHLSFKNRLRLLYFDKAQHMAVRQADTVLVRGRQLYDRYTSVAKHIELARPITSLSSKFAFQRDDTCTGDLIKLLYVGDLCIRKRPLDAVRAVAQVIHTIPDKTFQLTFAGKEHEIEEERVQISEILQTAKDLGIGEAVKCVGHVNDPASLSEYFRQSDIFLLLSSAEGFPRVVNEALLHSLPVVVTPVGGIPNELVESEHALFVPTDSPQAAAEAIVKIINDQQLRRYMIHEGYSWGIEQMREPSWHQHARLLGLL